MFISFSPNEQRGEGGGEGGGCAARPPLFFIFPVPQTTSGIGHRVRIVFRVGNQYAECEKQQQQHVNKVIIMGANQTYQDSDVTGQGPRKNGDSTNNTVKNGQHN